MPLIKRIINQAKKPTCTETGNTVVLMPDKSGSAFMRKKFSGGVSILIHLFLLKNSLWPMRQKCENNPCS